MVVLEAENSPLFESQVLTLLSISRNGVSRAVGVAAVVSPAVAPSSEEEGLAGVGASGVRPLASRRGDFAGVMSLFGVYSGVC